MNQGLTSHQARGLISQYGLNQLPKKGGISSLKILFAQIQNPLSYLLMGAFILSYFIGDLLDAFLILGIWLLNTLLGFWQEYKASKELEALQKYEVIFSRVIRDGKQVEIPSAEIVPGDVVILEAGDKVTADGEVLESFSLQINESVLTGESLPTVKSAKIDENLVFFGTIVSSGRGNFKVTKTGINTRFGAIAKTLTEVEGDQTPLEKALRSLAKGVGVGALLVATALFALRVLQGFEAGQMLLTSIALMVAAVPEGLPAVVTVILAMGVRKMYRHKALLRKMIAVESLGTATVILSDKTGTLTKNEMRVKEVEVLDGKLNELMKCATICNSASLVLKEDGGPGSGEFDILGDTTEGALLIWAKEKGHDIDLLRSEGRLLEEIPFNLESRKMSVVWQQDSKKSTYTKGAPEVVILESTLSEKERKNWTAKYQDMAKKGLRVLAFSKDKQFLGLLGIADEIRPEVQQAIKLTRQAGIKVVMVTGDNELTARAVGEEIGLLSAGDEVLSGVELDQLSEEKLLEVIRKVRIFARITPQAKLKIVRAYQELGEVVAVTGDGVNDALALKQAEVGVSMGSGTQVSKEASDIVLLDDNFATLITAVEQGRLIYSNILKVVKFLLTGNLAEVLLIGLAVVAGLPTPLLPTQILWINFVTDGFPALALGFDSASSNIMKLPPRKDSNILGFSMVRYILTGGFLIAILCLISFYAAFKLGGLENGRMVAFSLMVVLQMFLPFVIRRHHSFLSNKKLLLASILGLLSQALILTVPSLQELFKI